MDKKYKYNGKIYCEDDLSCKIDKLWRGFI